MSTKAGKPHRKGPVTKDWILGVVNIDSQSGCWNWKLAVNRQGYGTITENKTKQLATRVVYRVWFGEFDRTLLVCHKCDNEQCVNPDHLFLGTHQDNMSDMVSKGRASRDNGHPGETNGNAKLTLTQVDDIRVLKVLGVSLRRLAKELGVAKRTIQRIVRNNTWTKYAET
jgi:predicted DNA-binding protein (UPF0251 family)